MVRLGAVLAVLGAGAAALWAQGSEPGPDRVYVAAGSELEIVVVKAPLPTRQVGAAAVDALDRAAGHASGEPPPILGKPPAAIPPRGWPLELDDPGARSGRAPLGAREGGRACRCATEIGDADRERVAAVFALARFSAGDEAGEVRMLRLRARYHDGLVAYLNGREVARRNLTRGAVSMVPAERIRGREWETFYVPVTPGLLVRGENVLAIEVRPSGDRQAPVLDLELSGTGRARIARGPIVQRVERTAALIAFDTDLPATGIVEYGPTPELGRTAVSAGGAFAMRHLVELRDLPAAGVVHYRVISGSDVTPVHSFPTAAERGDTIRFVVYGDTRNGHAVHERIVGSIIEESPEFVLVTGDLVERGSDEGDWQRFFAVAGDLLARVPYYPAAGNHDVGRAGDERRYMNEIFALWPGPPDRPSWAHWYSFGVADLHFVMLDSNAYHRPEQLEWLERDLEAARARGARAIFAAVHDGPYSRGPHGGNRTAAQNYVPVLVRHGVTLLFGGHDHLYQRGRAGGLDYIVTGGGGAPLYSIRCGVPGRPACRIDDGMLFGASEYHYVLVVVHKDHLIACPKRPDRTPLEKCVRYRL